MSPTPRRLLSLPLLLAATLGLSSCAGFFICQKASCPATSTSTSTAGNDLVYVSNSASGSTIINGYAVSSGTLVAAASSPYSLGYAPSAMVVSTADTFLYTATDPALYTGSIYGYTIGTGGVLSVINGTALVQENAVALAVSPDGRFLFSLNASGLTMEQYSINTSTGVLTYVGYYSLSASASGGAITPYALSFAPSGNFLVATYELGGAQVFSYSYNSSTSTSTVQSAALLNPRNNADAFYGVAIDGNNYIYAATTSGLDVYATTSAGVATPVNSSAAYATGSGARGVVVNAAGNFVYVADSVGSQIYGFAVGTGGALTALSTPAFAAPTTVTALGRDNSGNYLLAEGYSSVSGIQIFSIGSGGALTSNNTAAGGTTSVPAVIAATH